MRKWVKWTLTWLGLLVLVLLSLPAIYNEMWSDGWKRIWVVYDLEGKQIGTASAWWECGGRLQSLEEEIALLESEGASQYRAWHGVRGLPSSHWDESRREWNGQVQYDTRLNGPKSGTMFGSELLRRRGLVVERIPWSGNAEFADWIETADMSRGLVPSPFLWELLLRHDWTEKSLRCRGTWRSYTYRRERLEDDTMQIPYFEDSEQPPVEVDTVERYFVHSAAEGLTAWVHNSYEYGRPVLAAMKTSGNMIFVREGYKLNFPPVAGKDLGGGVPIEWKTPDGEFHGAVDLPQAANPPLAVIIPGSGPVDCLGNAPGLHTMLFADLSAILTSHGYAVLRYGKPGMNGSRIGDDTPNPMAALRDAVEYGIKAVGERGLADANRVLLIGHSEGAYYAVELGSREFVTGVITLAGPYNRLADVVTLQLDLINTAHGGSERELEELKAAQLPLLVRISKATKPEDVRVGDRLMPMVRWMWHHWHYNPHSHYRALDKPMLVIGGRDDIQVSPDEAEQIEKLKTELGRDWTIAILDEVDHLLMDTDGRPGMGWYSHPNRRLSQKVKLELEKWLERSAK